MSLLKNRNYLILLSGQLVSTIGNNLYSIALPWFVLVATNSRADLAITGFFQSVAAMTGLFTGVLVDRWRKKQTMITSDIIRGILSLSLFILALDRHSSFILIVVLVLVMRAIGTVFSPASAALTPMIMEKEDIAKAQGYEQSGTSAAQLAGSIGGGAVMAAIGAPLLFLGNALSFVVSVISLFFIRVREERPQATKGTSMWSEWVDGMRVVRKSKFIILITTAFATANFALSPFGVFSAVWIKGPLHGTAFDLGLVDGSYLSGAIIGGLIVGPLSKVIPVRTELWTSLILVGICVALFGQDANLYWAMGCMIIVGIATGVLNSCIGAVIINTLPQSMIGRVVAPLGALAQIASPLGMAIFGSLMVHVSLPWLYLIIGICCVASGLSFLLPIKVDLDAIGDPEGTSVSL